MGKTIEKIPDETMEALMRWNWPGNIRELENLLERAVILTRGPVLYVPLAELESDDEEEEAEAAVPRIPTCAPRNASIYCGCCARPRARSADRKARPRVWA